jgi:hypothetical protein
MSEEDKKEKKKGGTTEEKLKLSQKMYLEEQKVLQLLRGFIAMGQKRGPYVSPCRPNPTALNAPGSLLFACRCVQLLLPQRIGFSTAMGQVK